MGFIILFSLIGIIGAFFIEGGILLGVTRLFKIENSTYKKSLITIIFSGAVAIVAGIVSLIIKLGFLSSVLVSIVSFFGFHYFYKKYYQSNWKKSLGIYITWTIVQLIFTLFVVFFIRSYIVQPFSNTGNSMSPTYKNGDYLLINMFSRKFSRGDVVIFHYPKEPTTYMIKRIVGLPSEKVDIKDGNVFIDGQLLSENYYNGETIIDKSITLTDSWNLSSSQYFFLGDNRHYSYDSRYFGPVDETNIIGKIFEKISQPVQ